jgi:hypothetical protein
MQKHRKSMANQMRALEEEAKPNSTLEWTTVQTRFLEAQIKTSLDIWSRDQPICQWSRSIVGIGPVISAGLAAHINIHKCTSPSSVWKYAGADPTSKWEKGKKIPWNADLKVLRWKIGESFVKTSALPNAYYSQFYINRKALETARNEAGMFAAAAAESLPHFDKRTEAYKAYAVGKLPLGRIHLRATRYATKIFLAHYFVVLYELTHKRPAPHAWINDLGGHADWVKPPNWTPVFE